MVMGKFLVKGLGGASGLFIAGLVPVACASESLRVPADWPGSSGAIVNPNKRPLCNDSVARNTRCWAVDKKIVKSKKGYSGFRLAEKLTVHSVTPNAPAEIAGLMVGDKLVAINSTEVTSENVLALLAGAPDSRLEVSVIRGQTPRTLVWRLANPIHIYIG